MPRRLLYKTYEVRTLSDANAQAPLGAYGGERLVEDSVFVTDFRSACLMAKDHVPVRRCGAIKGEVIGENGRVLRRYT